MEKLKQRKLSISPEKRQFFGIRKLKVGVVSVAVATALLFAAARPVSAEEATLPVTETTSVVSSAKSDESISSAESSVTEHQAVSETAAVTESPVSKDVVALSATETTSSITDTSVTEAVTGNNSSSAAETPIAEKTVRIHFEAVQDNDYDQYGLWTWGAVAQPSDGDNWPKAALPFLAEQKDDFGYYLDVKQAEKAGDIGYLLLKNGEKTSQADQKIQLLTQSMNEIWVKSDFTTYSYRPLATESLLRINYKRDDGNYDGWGLWLWGDTAKTSSDWPKDALDFENEGAYGRYIDVPLSRLSESKIGFLLVNQNDPEAPGNKSQDMTFSDRAQHSQIFLRNDESKVYTNPYYIETVSGQDFSKAQPGTKAISVTAKSLRAFNYNETGLIDVTLANPKKAQIVKMEVDTAQLGGGKIDISPQLNRVTITAGSQIPAGTYLLPIRVYDADNGYYDGTVSVTISERQKEAGERDWDEQVIYFMLTDRFYNGDISNDNPYHQDYAAAVNQSGTYKGGDFKGVTAKLDYLKELGVSSIWLTPIVENVPQNVSQEPGKEYYAYHGYWAEDFEKLNPHLGTLADFHELIDQAADRGINIIVDVVLNHAGYGTESKFAGMVRTAEEDQKGDDQKGSLSDLPDFKTENEAVRNQLVAWQSDWLAKAKTAKGNSIYAFRVDTVKHVDDVTWQHFKNELALKDPDFHLVGESWGANYKDTKGDLGTGTMDSLLDFGFKDTAKLLVNGRLKQANDELIARNNTLSSNLSLAQFLGSHDEDGFLYSIGGDLSKLKVAASLLLTAKGQPVIYYGEELAQSGANNWPIYDNRYEFDWTKTAGNAVLEHYKKLLAFRNQNSQLLSRGDRSTVAVSDSQQWLLAKRATANDAAYILYSLNDKEQELRLEVSHKETLVTDYYSGLSYHAFAGQDGKWYIDILAPSIANGGTMLLKVSTGAILSAAAPQVQDKAIQENHIRIHFKALPAGDLSSLGLWTWEDVETPSASLGAWPAGATSFSQAKADSYGYYLDVKLIEGQRDKLSLLINNTKGDNLTGDKSVDLISQDMNEVWFDENFKVHYYQPLAEGTIRINYYRSDGHYDKKSLWLWGSVDSSVTKQLGQWPDGIDFENQGKYGAYRDIKLSDFNELGFLLLDESKEGDAAKIRSENYSFKDLKNHSQIFLKDDDPTIYTNPYFVNTIRMTGAQQTGPTTIVASMTSLEGVDRELILKNLSVTDSSKTPVTITNLLLDVAGKKLLITGNFSQDKAPYQVAYLSDQFAVKANWQYKDALYAYDGELGARVKDLGASVDFTLWSPSADQVALVLYDKDDQTKRLAHIAMTKGDKGEWSVSLNQQSQLGIADYQGYYYHYEITRNGIKTLVLDPYAKSLAEWNSDLADTDPSYKVAKAAIVDPSSLGPKNLDYANIKGFTSREDAIIYEAHVRDFTSDTAIAQELTHQFGTFAAFVEKLDYLKDLGVTHIQLLPVMSYYYVNELKNAERMTNYSSSGNNYNWGYDPQSYFALTGMYSTNPADPAKRIEEFKHLVNEVHKRGMGIILDVVYNHTAKVDIFEDLEPQYYHFMDADGKARSSFGGGRLGTTHYMTRRLLVDSISYLVEEYKVDGFRFDMMGDHDAAAIEAAYNAAKALNPNIVMLGEGWVTYAGDEHMPQQPADQTWMSQTDTVASFSDDIRNNLKSGYPNEGQPAFITGGARDVLTIFNNIKAQPSNFKADDPGDVIQYIAAHDNLTLFDIIAQSIKKDPSLAENNQEIHRRLRLGNLLVLTSQGTAFLHSGQEYGRTKQFLDDAYKTPVSEDRVPNKSHLLTNSDGSPFLYPYFIHDSYDSTDAINHFDWTKATDHTVYPEHTKSQAFTKGLIALRRSTDAFRLKTLADVEQRVSLISQPNQNGVQKQDTVIAYQAIATNGDVYAVFVNADTVARDFVLEDSYRELLEAEVLVDANQAGIEAITDPVGVTFTEHGLSLSPLTATVLRLRKAAPELGERSLYDAKTGVTVILAAGETERITDLNVAHIETNDRETPEILLGQDFDLFDIELTDSLGTKVPISKPARVIMPIDAGKTVYQVVYLPTDQRSETLPFVEISQTVNGQTLKFVVFLAHHFSHYGIVYQNESSGQQADSSAGMDSRKESGRQQEELAAYYLTNPQLSSQAKAGTGSFPSHRVQTTSLQLPETGEEERYLSLAGWLGLSALACYQILRYSKSRKD